MELQHFSHGHPLIFNEDLDEDYYGFYKNCNVCQKQVSGPNYSCKQCFWFQPLHKSCAQLPHELRHPLHPKHPLLLINANQGAKCEGCNADHLDAHGFIYNCYDCKFNLDTKCASLPLTVEPESHAHPLTLMRRSVSFTCDACGKQGKGMFYSCAVCPFLVHLECASFPLTVKHIRHHHPLNLMTNPLHKSDHPLCHLCVKSVDTDYMVYYCSTCDFVTHLHCAANDELWGETFVPECLDESTDSFSTYVVLKSILGEPVEIKHFCHEHNLKLIDEQFEDREKCDACMWPISTPFYSCAECKFFLHKSCVELPKKRSHPLHQHPLILHQQPPSRLYVDREFVCNACCRTCNGLTYHCDKCKFDLDVQCSFMPDKFNHDGHDHQLILSSASYFDKCSSCDVKGRTFFRCANCDFSLDFKCATLPRTIRYGPYEQLFTLCYKDGDDSDNEYYCDICEEKRDPKHWFYYCAYLSFYAHPDCILGKSSYIKSRRTCQPDILHEHSLILVEGEHRLCDECGSLCNGLTYTCVRGDFSLHRWCFHKIKALRWWLYVLKQEEGEFLGD